MVVAEEEGTLVGTGEMFARESTDAGSSEERVGGGRGRKARGEVGEGVSVGMLVGRW